MRPVLAGVVSEFAVMVGRPLDLVDFADMNDALDVQAHNDNLLREHLERSR
jgi:hypothetical protein